MKSCRKRRKKKTVLKRSNENAAIKGKSVIENKESGSISILYLQRSEFRQK
jgi:hypothetical protein